MNIISKIGILFLIFLGEAFSIYAEMIGAKNNVDGQNITGVLIKSFLLITVAGAFLVMGYVFGFKVFKNIWVCSVVSITSILIMEPLIAFMMFKQLPSIGTGIGFILGAIGLYLSIFF